MYNVQGAGVEVYSQVFILCVEKLRPISWMEKREADKGELKEADGTLYLITDHMPVRVDMCGNFASSPNTLPATVASK